MEKKVGKGNIFVISGPTGSGKTTIINGLKEILPAKEVGFSVSLTTRPPRPNEVEGVHYSFVGKQKFEELRQDDGFLESALVHDEFYGTSRDVVMKMIEAGRDAILEIDVQGHEQLKRYDFGQDKPNIISIFLLPPDIQTIIRRLEKRPGKTNNLSKRIAAIRREINCCGNYDHWVISQENAADLALKKVANIIQFAPAGA